MLQQSILKRGRVSLSSRLLKAFLFLVLLFIFVLEQQSARAQTPELINDEEFRPAAQAAVDSIYNFNFEGAEELLNPWKKQHPDHPLWLLIDGMQLWWQVLSDLEDTSNDEEFFHRMKRTDYEASRLLRKNSSHADGLIIRTVANGYIARQYANRDEWMSSINTARKALSSYEYLSEIQPDLADLSLAEGLKFYYAAYLPEAYPIVKTVSWFLPEGDKKKGLQLMQEAADQAIFARAEATYFLGNINYHYQEDYDKAVGYFEELYQKYPHNNYYARKLVSSLYRLKRYDEAMRVIRESMQRWEKNALPFEEVLKEELLTWEGRIYLNRGERELARQSLSQAHAIGKELPQTRYRSFHTTSGYYLGKLLYEQKSYTEAEPYLRTVADSKNGENYQRAAKEMLRSMQGN